MSVQTNAKLDSLAINAIKFLAVDAINKAKSGHPGAPMGMADMAYVLWSKVMNYDPKNPAWPNRDRFILSGGHASGLLYALLHISGYGITMDDIKNFRQWGSVTSGHPEYDVAKGIEMTTGPLGAGVATAVGMAMAEKKIAATFNKPGFDLVNHKIYVTCGEGDLMEGMSYEAASLAGHFKLDNLVYLFDCNEICIEGDTHLTLSEDFAKRFESAGWYVQTVNGHDTADLLKGITNAKNHTGQPSIVICRTTIGNGSPNMAGKAGCHGSPLGAEEAALTKKEAGWEYDDFTVPQEVYDLFAEVAKEGAAKSAAWDKLFADYKAKFPEEAKLWDSMMSGEVPADLDDKIFAGLDLEKATASRAASGNVIQAISANLPSFIGGSADLAPANKTDVKGGGDFEADNYLGKNIHFGIREHAMGAEVNGMALYGGLIPYGATFLAFSDYMRCDVRLAALMGIRSIFVFSHDSIFVGEDGPTHQPIEHTASLRLIPNLTVFRPGNTAETAYSWLYALNNAGAPTCIILSRNNLGQKYGTREIAKGALKGGYVVKDAAKVDLVAIATGTELCTTIEAAEALEAKGIGVRVVSMPSVEVFEKQSEEYKESVLPKDAKKVVFECSATAGWYKFVGCDGAVFGIDHFGASAPAGVLAEKYGFDAKGIQAKMEEFLAK